MQNQYEKKYTEYLEVFYFLFGFLIVGLLGFIYFFGKQQYEISAGWLIGYMFGYIALMFFGYVLEFKKWYIKKYEVKENINAKNK